MSSLEEAKGEISPPTGHEKPEGCELGQTQELKVLKPICRLPHKI